MVLTLDECRYLSHSEVQTKVVSRWVRTVVMNEGALAPSEEQVDVLPNGVRHLVR